MMFFIKYQMISKLFKTIIFPIWKFFEIEILGFEFDYEEKLLFFSTYNEIYRKDLTTEHVQKIFPESGNTSAKFDMINFSLDWLNNDLYFLADLKGYKTFNIYKITFDGKKQDVVYSTHSSRIECFQVDPYNGYVTLIC